MVKWLKVKLFIVLNLICLVGTATPSPLSAQKNASGFLSKEGQIKNTLLALDLLLHRQYDQAQTLFLQWNADYPENILGPLGMVGLYQLKKFENFDFQIHPKERGWHKKSHFRAKKIYENPKSEEWEYLAAGGALGLTGFYEVQRNKWFRALGDSVLGVRSLKKALRKNPEFKDALLGIGLYEYWRSIYTKNLRFLPLFPDLRQEGINKITEAVEKSGYIKDLAQAASAFVYANEHRYTESQSMCRPLIKKYPENIILRLLLANSLTGTKKFQQAEIEYINILKIDPQNKITHFFMANNYYLQKKNLGLAKKLVENYLTTEPIKRWRGKAHALLGNILLAEGDVTGAKDSYQEALRIDSSLSVTRHKLKTLE
jgi:tetratricopeptide (TPR) repeat protein